MPFYLCSICEDDGSPVAERITVVIEETGGGDVSGWHGTITATHLTSLEAGRRYRLTLGDGRTGEFHVRRNISAEGTERAVSINGIGPLAPAAPPNR